MNARPSNLRAWMALVCLVATLSVTGCPFGEEPAKKRRAPSGFALEFVIEPSGAQIDRPFSMTVALVRPEDGTPFPGVSGVTVRASLASGGGALIGTLTAQANADGVASFDNLAIDALGDFALSVSAAGALSAIETVVFTVGLQRDLAIIAQPAQGYNGEPFVLTLEVRDTATGTPVAPGYELPVSIEALAGASTGAVAAGDEQLFDGSSSTLDLEGIVYDTAETARLRVRSPGFPPIDSDAIAFEGLLLEMEPFTSDPIVNGAFDISARILRESDGQEYEPLSPVSASLSVLAGGGTLAGALVTVSDDAGIVFAGMRYDERDDATFQIAAPGFAPVQSSVMTFTFELAMDPEPRRLLRAGETPDPVVFVRRDGLGQVLDLGAMDLEWEFVNANGGAVVASGTGSFTTPQVTIALAAVASEGEYELRGWISGSPQYEAQVDFFVLDHGIDEPAGPFRALKSVRAGSPYSDTIGDMAGNASIQEFGLLEGDLPPGLSIDPATGRVSGVPTVAGSYEFTMFGLGGASVEAYRCVLGVFSEDENEIVSGQRFVLPGPYTVQQAGPDNVTFLSSFDALDYSTQVLLYYPNLSELTAPAPVFVMHRGRGFNYNEYGDMLRHFASWGIFCASVEDCWSFLGAGGITSADYDGVVVSKGMESAGAFMEAVAAAMLTRATNPADVLYGKLSPDLVFLGGHSRGGGATHASHVRELVNGVRGLIYFMPFDLRSLPEVVAPVPPLFAIPTQQPRVPSLIVAAEEDGDLDYPYCDQLIDRATGPATFITVYGGNHARLSDSHMDENGSAPTISRAEQHARIFTLCVAFIKRWSDLDLSLDGYLYGNELAGSDEAGITAWRNNAERIVVDDFQDTDAATNALGGANGMTGGSRQEQSIYPPLGNFASVGIRHNILTFTSANAAYTTAFSPRDASRTRRLIFRMGQTGASGFDFAKIDVTVSDASGNSATVTLFDPANPWTTYLPDYPGSGPNVYDRFVEVGVPLTAFTGATAALDLSVITGVELSFTASSTPGMQVYMDDLRFE